MREQALTYSHHTLTHWRTLSRARSLLLSISLFVCSFALGAAATQLSFVWRCPHLNYFLRLFSYRLPAFLACVYVLVVVVAVIAICLLAVASVSQ